MGVTITATNPLHTFDMGVGGFYRLRRNIALALDEEFGKHYALIIYCHAGKEHEAHARKSEEIINRKHLDENYADVLDFLFASDVSGSISHKTCKKIFDLLKDKDYGNQSIRYTAYVHNDYYEFKEFLCDCYSWHKKMRWY